MNATIDSIRSQRLRYRLDKPVGGSGVAFVDVLIVDAELSSGHSGLGFSYVLSDSGAAALAACRLLQARIEGSVLHHPAATWRAMSAALNRTGLGPNAIALAAIDVALWDAYAKSIGQPLGCAMGGAPRTIDVYGSGGYHAGQTEDEICEVTARLAAQGFKAVKPRVDASTTAIRNLQALRSWAPSQLELMCDANEKCTLPQAQRLLHAARDFGYLFVEEPLRASDLNGYMALASAFPGLIAAGEHLQGMSSCLPWATGQACATFQPDLAMIGGLTPALELSRVADMHGVAVAPHFLPGLFVHLAAACPNLAWLEDFPLIEPLFNGWPVITGGTLNMTGSPGHGLTLDAAARPTFAIDD